jgi:hypothetical protein
MNAPPIKCDRAPAGAVYVTTLASGERMFRLGLKVFAVQP